MCAFSGTQRDPARKCKASSTWRWTYSIFRRPFQDAYEHAARTRAAIGGFIKYLSTCQRGGKRRTERPDNRITEKPDNRTTEQPNNRITGQPYDQNRIDGGWTGSRDARFGRIFGRPASRLLQAFPAGL
ncbi:MAG: hypothetical protein EHM23_20790 [Acidobacteria bacterium]|nr:MAG: hypothetical protein EHM23_20790 [Acidobacteriota bacterium]